jgi:plasmid stabilization system protein ParE
MFQLRWTLQAAQDFEDLIEHIRIENPPNARLVRDRILKSVENLRSFSLGLPAPGGTFKLYIPKTSYFVIFRRDDRGEVGIRAFVHASRDWEQIDWENL